MAAMSLVSGGAQRLSRGCNPRAQRRVKRQRNVSGSDCQATAPGSGSASQAIAKRRQRKHRQTARIPRASRVQHMIAEMAASASAAVRNTFSHAGTVR